MAAIGANFNGNIFHKDFPMVIATNRSSAVLLPVRLAYNSDGYPAGQVLGRNTTSGLYVKYTGSGASGIDVARAVLFDAHAVEDFDSTAATGSTMGVGIFGGCTVFVDKLTGLDSDAIDDLNGVSITDATGVAVLKF